jgi:hypothetical protein
MKVRELFVATSLALVLMPACAADPPPPPARRNVTPTPAPTPEPTGPTEDDRELDVSRPEFQAKSSAQLARSVEACVGRGATVVDTSMIVTPENASGFLTSDFANGNDIVAVQKLLFDGTTEALRTGVRVDQVTLEYITALKNVANVVGRRCAGSQVETPALCACETEADAKAMVARCLAAVADPTTPEFAALAADFQKACAANRGSAIASMIASLAFAKVP